MDVNKVILTLSARPTTACTKLGSEINHKFSYER